MKTNDIGRLVNVGSPAVSPDGSRVAYTVTRVDLEGNSYRSAIWLAAADGSAPPRQLTAGEQGDGQPAWSPDGTRLAFTRRRDGQGEAPEQVLLVLPVDGPGEPVALAHGEEAIEHPVWSPDGRSIAYTSRVRDQRYEPKEESARPPRKIETLFTRLNGEGWTVDRRTQAFVVDSEAAAAPRQLTEGPEISGPLAWSPDSKQLAFVSARQPDWDLNPVDDVWTIDVTGIEDGKPEPVRVTATDAGHLAPSWSPDGTRLAYLTSPWSADHPGYYHTRLDVRDLRSGETARLARDLDRTLFPFPGGRAPVWDGDDLLVSVEDQGSVNVLRVSTRTGSHETAVGGVRAVNDWDLRGGTLAFAATDATHPTELFSLRDGQERRLTDHQDAFLRAVPALEPERFTVRSTDGKVELDAWLLRPPGFDPGQKYPALLSIHGGPASQYAERWFDEFQFLAGAGFVVFWTNPRGSSGYTEAFGRAIMSPKSPIDPGSGWGGVDYEDVMAVTDAALEREPAIDSERLGVLGGSYGGYMTSWIVGHTDRFAAACSERAVNNLLSEEWTSDVSGGFAWEIGVDPMEDPEEYLRMSPATYVKEMTTPLLIIHSEDDWRCPIEQADCLWVSLRRLKRDVEYYRFTAESHELSRSGSPKHRAQRADLIVDFFTRRLAPA